MSYYIQKTPTADGWYGVPVSTYADGLIELPDKLLNSYIGWRGYVTPVIKNNAVYSITNNSKALNAYLAAHPEPETGPTLEERVAALETAAEQSDVPDRVAALEEAVGDANAGELADMKMAMQQALGHGGSVDVTGRVGALEDSVSALEDTVNNLPTGGGDADAVWDEMAAAYREGVNNA